MSEVNVLTAFIAGFLSFISPCVLPLIPAYISYISGISLEELRMTEEKGKVLKRVSINSFLFILGFTVVFVSLGASASFIGQFLLTNKLILEKIAGVIIVIFGIHLAGIFRIKFLDYERKVQIEGKPLSFIGSFLIGFAFAFGWTPCIGPILGSILAIAAVQETVVQGMGLLAIYSLGLGVPFFLSGLFINIFFSLFGKIRKYFRIIELFAGIFLIILGILIFFGQFERLITLIS